MIISASAGVSSDGSGGQGSGVRASVAGAIPPAPLPSTDAERRHAPALRPRLAQQNTHAAEEER